MFQRRFQVTLLVVAATLLNLPAYSQDAGTQKLAAGLKPLLNITSGRETRYALSANVEITINRTAVPIEIRLVRFDNHAFDLDLIHTQYSVQLRRRRDATALALPHHRVVFLGRGESDPRDRLDPEGILGRLVSPASTANLYLGLLGKSDPSVSAVVLSQLLKIQFDDKSQRWNVGNNVSFGFGESTHLLDLTATGTKVSIRKTATGPILAVDDWKGFNTVSIERPELERQLVRGIRRATEILAPAAILTSPPKVGRRVDHGDLRWIDGHRVVLLDGTPEQIGKAHGELLRDEAVRCFDSVLCSFGTAQTILNGRWFRHDLEHAYSRLSPHIPEDHKQETRALAMSLELDPGLVEVGNVFPEMFHCSGFALFGSATQDGKLYHGRVLDYMTMIGLQDAATTFIVAPKGKIPFANVGYGGFIGSVSGMNAKAISLEKWEARVKENGKEFPWQP